MFNSGVEACDELVSDMLRDHMATSRPTWSGRTAEAEAVKHSGMVCSLRPSAWDHPALRRDVAAFVHVHEETTRCGGGTHHRGACGAV